MVRHKYWLRASFLILNSILQATECQYFMRRNGTFLSPFEEDNFWSHHPPGKPSWLASSSTQGEKSFRPSTEILTPTFSNLQAQTVDSNLDANLVLPEDGPDYTTKISSWNQLYVPEDVRPKSKKRKRHRNPVRASNRETISCAGTCRNAFSCMITGFRPDKTVTDDACPGILNVCCIRWGTPPSSVQVQALSRRQKSRQKGARALGSLFTPYFTAATANTEYENIIFGSSASSSTSGFQPLLFPADDYSCGQSKNAQRKIMGGLDAGYGQFPWTAYIKVRGPGIDKVCSGTLIAKNWIITAGHCTQYCFGSPDCTHEVSQSEITYKVILGEYDLLFEEDFPIDVYQVEEVLRHPFYQNVMRYRDSGVLESEPRYDIALMRLDRPVKFAPNVGKICLPQLGSPLMASPNTLATVVGWGRLGSHESDPHSNVLQAVTVPVLDDTQCQIETGLPLYSDQLCAGGTYTDESACPGDSGGGLQVQDEQGRWTLIGIVSNGPSICGLQPVVFHKVEHSIDWIMKSMQNNIYTTP